MITSMDRYDFKFKHVLIRVDFNVPTDERLKITDDTRITESLPSIEQIIDDGGIPIILSHMGRPRGKKNAKFSLEIVANYMDKKWGYNVIFASDCLGKPAQRAVDRAKPGDIVLLENLRFYDQEVANDMEFAKEIGKLGDVYVNDAFGTVHREHASIHALPSLFTKKFAGKSVMYELRYLKNALNEPKSPYVAVVGGAKISGKIEVIRELIKKCDKILIGGGMMFTFMKAKGYEIGRSIYEADAVAIAKELMTKAKVEKCDLILPSDVVIADRFANDAERENVPVDQIPKDWIGMDIGIDTRNQFTEIIKAAKTVAWNGPMGVFEMKRFSMGTKAVAYSIANATAHGATTILGGGDSAAAMRKLHLFNKVTHVTPGGGAWLKYMEGKGLPGIEALKH